MRLGMVGIAECIGKVGMGCKIGVGMHHVAVTEAFAPEMEGHVIVALVSGTIVVVHVERHRHPVHAPLELRHPVVVVRILVEHAHGNLRKAVPVLVIEQEGHLPIEAEVVDMGRVFVYLQEGRLSEIIGIEVGQAVMLPVTELKTLPVDTGEHPVIVSVDHCHIMPAVASVPFDERILHHEEHGGIPIGIRRDEIEDHIVGTAPDTVSVPIGNYPVSFTPDARVIA